jgi:hypothetical protein
VELWAGREIVLGERYRVDLVTRMPLLDGVPIRMDGELQVSGRVPCDGGNGPARCVELVLVTRPDPLELLPLLGADAEADLCAYVAGIPRVVRPSDMPHTWAAVRAGALWFPPEPPLDRNKKIVFDSDEMIAAPSGPEVLRSGTWSTVRYARKTRKKITVIYPDGSLGE